MKEKTTGASRPYRLGIAPSHITVAPDAMLATTCTWPSVAAQTDLYKYYGVQFLGAEWASQLDPTAFVETMQRHGIDIGCEFGSFHLGSDQPIADAAEAAIRQIAPVFEAGGEVASLHLDGPVRRVVQGMIDSPEAMELDTIAAELALFWKQVHAKYPDVAIGLITNFPNWDYTGDYLGRNGHWTDQTGHTYAEILDAVYDSVTASGEDFAFLELDCPFNYYRAEKTRTGDASVDNAAKFRAVQDWCRERSVPLHLIVNAEPGDSPHAFRELTLKYIDRLAEDGIHPDLFIVQSWYNQPPKQVPETEPGTFMHAARDVFESIREHYPCAQW